MTTPRTDLLLWARRVIARKASPAHEILELKPTASVDDAQAAFYKIARVAHPDLHRSGMTPEDLELLTSAYSTAACAYQEFRSPGAATRMKSAKPEDLAAAGAAPGRSPAGPTSTPPSGVPSSAPVAEQMNSRALTYYRKAEIALRRGDLKGAILQIKMAIATDPGSSFLRSALAEVDAELRKGP